MAANKDELQQLPEPAAPFQINFRDQFNNEVTFKMKPTAKFSKAMDAFARRVEREAKQLRFIFNGERILSEDTIESKEMEEGDTIDVFPEQIGGATEDVDHDEDDEDSAKRLQSENEALKIRLTTLELSAQRPALPWGYTTVVPVYDNKRGSKMQLHFYDQRNVKVTFELTNTARLSKAIEAYANRNELPVESVRCVWNGVSVGGELSPFEIGMKHNDRVNCYS